MKNVRSLFFQVFCIFLLPSVIFCKGQLKHLNDTTWPELLNGEWMVEFFAPWCPACQQLEPVWKDFSKWSDDLNIKVASIDVTLNPGLSGRFMISSLPTIFHVRDGNFRQYRGPKDKDTFITFIEEKRWTQIEPVSGWKSPQSFTMSIVSYFFKLSMTMRNIHNALVQDYGIPQWGSYTIFGLSTILIGAILGLMVVCILDFVCPSKSIQHPVIQPQDVVDEAQEMMENLTDFDEDSDAVKEQLPEEALVRKRPKPPRRANKN